MNLLHKTEELLRFENELFLQLHIESDIDIFDTSKLYLLARKLKFNRKSGFRNVCSS